MGGIFELLPTFILIGGCILALLFIFICGDGMNGGTGKFLSNGDTGGDGEVVGRIGLKPGN